MAFSYNNSAHYGQSINMLIEEVRGLREDSRSLQKAVKKVENDCEQSFMRIEERPDEIESGIIKLRFPRVERQEYGHNSNVQDVFDELKDELDHVYKDKVWSSIDEDLKSRMKEKLKNGLIASDMQVPREKDLLKRLRRFYAQRRATAITKTDEEKLKKRKHALKASRRTYTVRKQAVSKAITDGTVNPANENEVSAIRMSIPSVTIDEVSPPDSGDEEECLRKKVVGLKKARDVKNRKRNREMQERQRSRIRSNEELPLRPKSSNIFTQPPRCQDEGSPSIFSNILARNRRLVECSPSPPSSPSLFGRNTDSILARDTFDDDDATQLPY